MIDLKDVYKVNCRNRSWVEGYVQSMSYSEDNGRCILEFTLVSINTNQEGQVYLSPFPIVAYGNRARMVKEWLKDEMLVEVEGRIRFPVHPADNLCIVAVYIEDVKPKLMKVIIPENKKN